MPLPQKTIVPVFKSFYGERRAQEYMQKISLVLKSPMNIITIYKSNKRVFVWFFVNIMDLEVIEALKDGDSKS